MRYVKNIARTEGIIVVATIHQPSMEVYHGFDTVMLLSSGRTAYRGPAKGVTDYFSKIGYPVDPGKNPAEFMLDQVNREFVDPDKVDNILDLWEAAERKGVYPVRPAPDGMLVLKKGNAFRTGFVNQSMTLLSRQGKLVAKDPMLYVGRCIVYIMSMLFFSIIYVSSRERNQRQVLFRTFLIMWHVGLPSSFGVIAVFAFNTEFHAITREFKNGMLRPLAYICATTLLQIPLMVVMAICALGPSAYGVGNWYGPNFPVMVLTLTTILWGYENLACLFSVQSKNPLMGMLNYMQSWFMSFLFCGVMVAEDDVIWPFRVFCSILPLKWGLATMGWIEFSKDTTFSGALPCGVNTPVDTTCYPCSPQTAACVLANRTNEFGQLPCPLGTVTPMTGCRYRRDQLPGATNGWFCPDPRQQVECWGVTGDQVIDSLGQLYKSMEPTDHVARNLLISLGIALGLKLLHILLISYRIRSWGKLQTSKPAGAKHLDGSDPKANGKGSAVQAVDAKVETV